VILPCELIERNGDALRELILRYAAEWRLGGDFRDWLESCDFCNTLVDRIVPGYPEEEAAALASQIGYEDRLLDAGELFYLWVIETKNQKLRELLPFEQAGLKVVWTEDLSFYHTRKVRILNGAHTSGVAAAFLAGFNTVGECVRDSLIRGFMRKAVFEEIIPSMDSGDPGGAEILRRYGEDTFERFANPYVKHQLLSISLNSVSKFKTRVLPSLKGYFKKTGKLPPALCFSLAALIAFYRGAGPVEGELRGSRGGESYPIRDETEVLAEFAALHAGAEGAAPGEAARLIAASALGKSHWWGEDLNALAGLTETTAAWLELIWSAGIRAALKSLTGER
jgi:tagaturonate reductase